MFMKSAERLRGRQQDSRETDGPLLNPHDHSFPNIPARRKRDDRYCKAEVRVMGGR
jgi:hypothetical protein